MSANLASNDDTLLAAAAYENNIMAVQLPFQHGANPNLLNGNGMSPLAASLLATPDTNIARFLYDAGADPNLGSPTAYQVATQLGDDGLQELFAKARSS